VSFEVLKKSISAGITGAYVPKALKCFWYIFKILKKSKIIYTHAYKHSERTVKISKKSMLFSVLYKKGRFVKKN
jgi:hypothetical protein